MKQWIILSILFLFLTGIATATMYINDNKSLYRSYDNANFELIAGYQVSDTDNVSLNIRALQTDRTGRYVGFIDGNLTDSTVENNRKIMISRDYGETFIAYPADAQPYQDRFLDYAMSKNGMVQAYITTTHIFISTDYGLNFNNISIASTSLQTVSISDDGLHIAISESIGASKIFINNNYTSFTGYNNLASGYYVGSCWSGTILYAIGQSGINSYQSIDNGSTWTQVGAYSGIGGTNIDILCQDNKIILQQKYSSNNFSNTINSGFLTYGVQINNMSQIYSTNGTVIRQSTDGQNFSNYLTGFISLSTIAVSDYTYQAIPSIRLCLDSETFCSNASYNYVSNSYACNQQYVQHCSSGCINISGQPICQNICENECNIEGSKGCYNSVSLWECEDINNDGCYEKNPFATCSSGETCVDAYYFASCQGLNYSGVLDIGGFNVLPYAVNDNITSYGVDSNARIIAVKSTLSLHQQKFYTQGTGYISRTCNYKETQIFSDSLKAINESTIFSFPSIASASRISLSIIPYDNIPVTVRVKSMIGADMDAFTILRNSTALDVCLYELNGTVIFCDYDYSGFDSLQKIDIDWAYDFQSDSYSVKFLFDRIGTDSKKLIDARNFIGNDLTSIEVNSTASNVSSIKVFTMTQSNAFSALQVSNNSFQADPNFLPCLYTSEGTYTVRTYQSNNPNPSFINYQDWTVNVQKLGASQLDIQGEPTSQANHVLWALIISLAVLLIGGIGTAIATHGDSMAGVTIGFIGLVISLIIFTVLTWLPIWLMILIIVIASGILSLFISKIITGGGGVK